MADAQYGEGRQFNLHSAGTDLVEGSALAVKSSSGAITVDGVAVSTNVSLFVTGPTASDAVLAGAPITIGGRASNAAPTAMSADGDVVDARFTRTGALNVYMVDQAGAAASLGGGTQYVGDAAITATPTGTVQMGLANASAPTDVSANNDAVALWANRSGSLNVVLRDTSGVALSVGGGTQYVGDAAITATPTGTISMGLANATAPTDVSANNDAVSLWANRSGSLNVVLRDTAGVAVVSGTQYVGDAAATTTPTGTMVMGLASSFNPTNVSADSDAVALWANLNGSLNIIARDTSGSSVFPAPQPATGDGLSLTTTYIQNFPYAWGTSSWDRQRGVLSLSTAPNVDTGILAVGDGPGWDRKRDPTGVPATGTSGTTNAVTVIVNGADVIAFHVTTIGTTPGSMIFETTGDDGTWATAGMVVKLATGPDLRIEGAFVPAVNDVYLVRVTGHRQVRYRVNAAYASGTATVKVTSALGVGMIKSMDMGAPPHNFGYALASATAQYTTTQTSTTLGPTVASTQRMVVTSIQVQAGGTTAGTLQVYFGTGAYSRGTSKAIFDGEFAPSSTLKPGYALAPLVPWMGAADEELKVTDSAAVNPLTVTVWYYLVAA